MPELVLYGVRLLAKQLLGTVLDNKWTTLLLVRHPGRQHHPPPHPGLHAEVHRDHPQSGDGVRLVGPPASLSLSPGVAPGNFLFLS